MKRNLFLIFIIVSLLLTSSCGISKSPLKEIRDRGVLRVGVKLDVPGFGYIDPATDDLEGMEIDLARAIAVEILGKENAEVEFIGVTSKTRGPLLNNEGLDLVIATFTITEERQELFNFTEPYYKDELGFMVKKRSPLRVMADMDGRVTGVAQGGTAKDALLTEAEKKNISLEFKEYASYPEVIGALYSGEVDMFSADKSILRGYLDYTTMILDEGFNPQYYGIATRLENTQLSEKVDSILETMQSNGELDALIEKWDLN